MPMPDQLGSRRARGVTSLPESTESTSGIPKLADAAEDAASIQWLRLLASHLVDPLMLDLGQGPL